MNSLALLCALAGAPLGSAVPPASCPPPQAAPVSAAPVPGQSWDEESDPQGPGLDSKSGAPLPNFGRVTETLSRSGQPTREGLAELARLGFKTVLTLRDQDSEEERRVGGALGLKVLSVPMEGLSMPSFPVLDRVVDILSDPAHGKLLVHCRRGVDRTGVSVAAYRVVIQGWGVERAAREAEKYGCCHPLYGEIRSYLRLYRLYRRVRATPELAL